MFDIAMRVTQAAATTVQQTTANFQTVLQTAKGQTDTVPPQVVQQSQAFIDKYDTAKYDRRFDENVKDGKLDAKELAKGMATEDAIAKGLPAPGDPSPEAVQGAATIIAKYNTPGDRDNALDVNELGVAVLDDMKAQAAGNDDGGGPSRGDGNGGGGGGGGGGGSSAGGAGFDPMGGLWALLLQLIDSDHDGKISDKEARDFAAKYGGTVDKAELLKALQDKAKELGIKAPTDAEVDAYFGKADTQKSNDLDVAELTALKQPEQGAAA